MAFTFGAGTGGFGQQNNQQQQQQQAAPTFGGFGNNAATSTFGSSTPAFGQQPQQQQTSLFGSTGGGFGSTNTAATPAFGAGATNTGGGLFGSQPASTGGAFGGGGSTFSFGQSSQPATGGGLFGGGGTSTGFGAGLAGGNNNANPNDPVNPNVNCPMPTNGSADAPPHPKDSQKILMWKDNRNGTQTGSDGKQTTITGEQLLFDNIVALPMYWHASPEELRAQDYAQNRKTAPAAATTGSFGGFGQTTGTGAFGAAPAVTTGFGQTQPAGGGGLFGSQPSTNTGGGLFGGAGGAFGKPATTTPAFGQSTTGATGGGLFGQPAASTSTTTGFGQTNTGTSTFGGFGQNNQQQAKPAFSFGGGTTNTAQPAGGGLFGGGAASTGFGQTQQSQTTAPSFGGFGQTNTGGGGGLFGNNAAKPATGGLFGNAGATADKPSFSFGQNNTATQPTGGLFGNTNQQQGQQQPAGQTGGGLFGNLGGGTSTFGQQNNTASTGLGGGLFGNNANKPAGGGLFGNNTATQQPALNLGGTNNNTGGGLFGGGGSSLFGNNNANQQNNQQQQQQQPQQGGGLFGGSSLFGNTLGQNQNNNASTGNFGLGQSGSTFGGFGQTQNQQNNLQQSQQQQPLQPLNTSIDENPYGNNPIFANVQPLQASGPQAVTIDSAKKQPALTISYRGVPRSTPKINKLRGFTTSVSSPALAASRFGSPAGLPGTPLGNSTMARSATSSPALALLNNNGNGSFTLPPEAFVARPSVKKLVIDQKHRESSDFLFRKRNGTATPTSGQQDGEASGNARERITFNSHAETAERGEGANGSRSMVPASSANKGKAPAMSASSFVQGAANGKRPNKPAADRPLSDGDYYSKPSLAILKSMSQEDLGEVHDLTVGRVGFGEVCWLEPADLTGLQSLDELMGQIVIIEDREVMVYPGEYEDDKPEVGHGLNVPAAVSLKNCWPLDKATRNPIKDGNNARVQQHVKKLRKKQETEFVDFEIESGTWIFKVQHFSRYGLDESDEEEEDDNDMQTGQESSSPAVQRKKAIQDRASRTAKRTRTAESPTSDTSTEPEDADYDEAPPQATLEDESMTELDESATERSLSRTPRRPSPGASYEEDDYSDAGSEDEPQRRRKRSVAAPTPRFAPTSRLRNLQSPVKSRFEQSRRGLRQDSPSNASMAPSETAAQRPIAQRLGLEPNKLAVMQASFFSQRAQDIVPALQPPPPVTHFSQPPAKKQHVPSSIPTLASSSAPPARERQDDFIPTYKPLRKWKDIPYTQSLAYEKSHQLADAGLALGRSFRASWGPQGQLVHIGRLTTVNAASEATRLSLVKIDQLTLLTQDQAQVADSAVRLLTVQLEHSEINTDPDSSSPPLIQTQPSLRFRHFASQFSSQDPSHEANLWRLGLALFDEIDLRLSDTVSQQVRSRVDLIRRRDAFSAWLKTAVAPAVEQDLRALSSSNSSGKAAATVFALLTGNQVERACQSALSNGDVRLASLLAQVGGDDEFRADIDLQLQKWREYRVDPHLSKEYRKIYEVLSGNVEMSKGINGHGSVDTSEDIMISEGLDWKRALAVRFWYAQFDHSIPQAVAIYDQDAADDERLSQPSPEHTLAEKTKRWSLLDSASVHDVLYEIIQLFTDATKSLESALSPRAFTASPVDYRQSWHLYEILARSMQIREFEDVDSNGYSAKAEELAVSYADQLEKAGLWLWAAFVYLHLVNSESRTKAIEELLARRVADFTPETTAFLKDKLKISQKYLDEAQDTYGEAEEENGLGQEDEEEDMGSK